MSARIDRLKPRDKKTGLINVIIETPAGSRSKFRYDEDTRLFQLDKLLPLGAAFPYDFGFVPGTLAEDGDPLDLILIGAEATFAGCHVTARLLGVIEAKQTEAGKTIRNDRLIGTAETERIHPPERSISDLPKHVLDDLERFFVSYNQAEGRSFVPLARRGPATASKLVDESARSHGKHRSR